MRLANSLSLGGISLIFLSASSTRADDVNVPVKLGGGIVTRTNVLRLANLAADLRDIRSAASTDEVNRIYRQGRNSEISAGNLFSLQQIGNEIETAQYKSPDYIFHQFGLAQRSTNVNDLYTHDGYAASEINFIISAGQNDLAADAIIALDLWMYASHMLFSGAFLCEEKTQADAPDLVNIGMDMRGGGMDEFIALWIGVDQVAGSVDGHGLYAWTERIAEVFQTATTEATVNTRLKILYEEGIIALNLPNACSKSNSATAKELWTIAIQMLSQMTVPLYQWLISSILERNAPAAQIYAKALIPHLSQCRPSQHARLVELLMGEEGVDFSQTDEIISTLQQTLGCFDITCRDLGEMNDYEQTACSFDDDDNPVLAGFSTSSDVKALSRLDLDVYQMGVLAALGSFEYATLFYKYGKNSPTHRDSETDPFSLLSLYELAVSADRKRTSAFYRDFVEYHSGKNTEYGNTAIMNTLDGMGKWGSKPTEQRAKLIVLTAVFHVVYLECIALFRDAFKACEDSDSEIGFVAEHNPLDQAAALFIGYMEGELFKGSRVDGQLTFGLANEQAFYFDTLSKDEYAVVNSEVQDLLYSAKGELDALDCIKVSRTVSEIEKLMMIPLLQGIAQAAAITEPLAATSNSVSLVEGEVLSLAVLPSINALQTDSADTIYNNMYVTSGNTVPDGAQAVGDAVGKFTTQGMELSCRYIGGNDEMEPCRLYGGRSSGERAWSLAGLVVSALAGLFLI